MIDLQEAEMNFIREQAEEKLAAYRLEADVRRQLPKSVWRVELAQVLRQVAEKLEPAQTASA